MKHIITLALLCLIQIGCNDKNEKTLCHEFFMKGPPFTHNALTCDYGGEIAFEKIGNVTYVVCGCNNEKKKEIVE